MNSVNNFLPFFEECSCFTRRFEGKKGSVPEKLVSDSAFPGWQQLPRKRI